MTETAPAAAGTKSSGVTLRAFLTGLVCSALVAGGTQYGEIFLRSSRMSDDFSTGGALFVFFFLVAGVNVVLKLLGPRVAFSPAELILVYVMMMTSCAVTGMGLTHYQIPLMATLPYFATPRRTTGPTWWPPSSAAGWWSRIPWPPSTSSRGLPEGASIPWGLWLRPLAYWSVFFAAFYFAMVALMVILRKQWIENERLIYPIIRAPLDMIGERRGGLLSSFFKNPLMWLGFAVASIVTSSIGLHEY